MYTTKKTKIITYYLIYEIKQDLSNFRSYAKTPI